MTPLPKVIGLRLEPVELVRCMVGIDVLTEAAEHLQNRRGVHLKMSYQRPLV